MISLEQKQTFEERGYVRLSSVFSKEQALAMQDRIWRSLEERFSIDRLDSRTWKNASLPLRLQHLQGEEAFKPIGNSPTIMAIDAILGEGAWVHPWHWGQFLVGFPTGKSWDLPKEIWHTDFGFEQPIDQLSGVLVFSIISDVQSEYGGTGIVSGSHRLIKRFLEQSLFPNRTKMKPIRKAFMAHHPWLEQLAGKGEQSNRRQTFMERDTTIDGIPLKAEEITGQAGDVIIAHPWLLHCSSPNCSDQVKMMRVQRVHRKEE
ncbi:MAG: phytanoyl-CoA dioxygenase family protein [Bacteroidota bacterium]